MTMEAGSGHGERNILCRGSVGKLRAHAHILRVATAR